MLRRACGLLLAVGLVPAASGGAVCLAHWTGHTTASPSAHEARAHEGHALDAHTHHAPGHSHGERAPMPPSDDIASAGPSDTDHAPAHDPTAPCTALAACGAAAAPESTGAITAAALPHAAVRIAAHTMPRGPAYTPDVPPPRR